MLREAAGDADGVAYLAFSHDFARTGDVIGDAIGDEARAVAALGDALVDTGKPLVLASGTPAVAGRASTEDDPFNTEGPMAGRGRTGQAVIDLAERGVRSAVVRLPRSVHDAGGRYGFAGMLIQLARRRGCRPSSATARNAGPRCTATTRRRCSGWPSSRPRPARYCMRWVTKATRCGRSPR